MQPVFRTPLICAAILFSMSTVAFGHGNVAPQPINTDALPDLPEDWQTENPYRSMGDDVMETAIKIGGSGFNQNCARCHGLEAISGGIAPDLRHLEAEEVGDEWFAERFQGGYTQNGVTKMPAFGELLGQKAGWAIRTYIETRPDDEKVTELTPQLLTLRDELAAGTIDGPTAHDQLVEISGQIETLSGSKVSDSVARRAAMVLPGNPTEAVEILTIGLSAAQ